MPAQRIVAKRVSKPVPQKINPKRKTSRVENCSEFEIGKKDALEGRLPQNEEGPYFEGYSLEYGKRFLHLIALGLKHEKECERSRD